MGIRLKLCKSNFIFNLNKEEFEMARKMKTMDGNHAAAHASYAFSDVAAIYLVWRKLLMSGQHMEEKTCLDRKYRLQRCSLRLVQPVQFTVLWQQVL